MRHQFVAAPVPREPAGQAPELSAQAREYPGGHGFEEEDHQLNCAAQEQEQGQADKGGQKKDENGGDCHDVAEGVTNDGGLVHWNPINSPMSGSGCLLPMPVAALGDVTPDCFRSRRPLTGERWCGR